ncbi:hypothetical protein M426DRAFT_247122 [Hypoxylon sp. CI-4A]|nr:hypothetical protein M426DRAFT_247122 [Hypoxylon sp. CI-4A]
MTQSEVMPNDRAANVGTEKLCSINKTGNLTTLDSLSDRWTWREVWHAASVVAVLANGTWRGFEAFRECGQWGQKRTLDKYRMLWGLTSAILLLRVLQMGLSTMVWHDFFFRRQL